MPTCPRTIALCFTVAACATSPAAEPGTAEVRVDAAALIAADITRVTIDADGQLTDLTPNPASSTFDGTVFLPSGTHTLVARGFQGTTLVAQSSPTVVLIQPGIVTRTTVRMFDLTGGPAPVYGPIFDSLSFPTTTEAGAPATFSISVIAPANDPVTYSWSSSCGDSTFAPSDAATTHWSKPTEGTCTITAVAVSNGFAVTQIFSIIVFPAGAGTGAVAVTGVLVTGPQVHLQFESLGCFVSPGQNASCPLAIASPSTSQYTFSVFDWGGAAPGTFELSDNCGGRFGVSFQNGDFATGFWLPPTAGTLCLASGQAVNGDGLASTVTAAILAHAGTPPMVQPPQIFAQLGFCTLSSTVSTPVDCGQFLAGSVQFINLNVQVFDGQPGSLELIDDCGGSEPRPGSTTSIFKTWTLPAEAGRICHITARASNLQGTTVEANGQYRLF